MHAHTSTCSVGLDVARSDLVRAGYDMTWESNDSFLVTRESGAEPNRPLPPSVLKVCETKGVAVAFLRKCVNLKSLGGILASFEVSRSFFSVLGRSFFRG